MLFHISYSVCVSLLLVTVFVSVSMQSTLKYCCGLWPYFLQASKRMYSSIVRMVVTVKLVNNSTGSTVPMAPGMFAPVRISRYHSVTQFSPRCFSLLTVAVKGIMRHQRIHQGEVP
jgi:hypothetical protein